MRHTRNVPITRALLATLTAAAVIAGPAGASAASTTYTSTVTIRPALGTVFGKVLSKHAACRSGRVVNVYYQSTLPRATYYLDADGPNVSGPKGDWSVFVGASSAPTPKGNYYATAKARRVSGGVCRAARSPILTVGR